LNLKKKDNLDDYVEIYKKAMEERQALMALLDEDSTVMFQIQRNQGKDLSLVSKEPLVMKQSFPSVVLVIPGLNQKSSNDEKMMDQINIKLEQEVKVEEKENNSPLNKEKKEEEKIDDEVVELTPEQWERGVASNNTRESKEKRERKPHLGGNYYQGYRGGRGGYSYGWKSSRG